MQSEIQNLTMQIVIQFGGTSREQYLHSFGDKIAAKKFIKSASRSGYRCLGPFSVALPEVTKMVDAAKAVVNSAKRTRFKNQCVQELARSVTAIKKGFEPC